MEEIIEKEIEQLKDREDVKAVAIVGSYARRPEQEHNDIDILIIVDGGWRKRKTTEKDNLVIEKFFNSRKWIEKYIEEMDGYDSNWNTYHWLKNRDTRYDPENILKELEQEAENKKEVVLNREIDTDEIRYRLWDHLQDLETENVAQKRHLMNQLFNYVINQKYRLERQVPVKENYKLRKLKEFDGYMYKMSQDYLLESSTMKKEKTLRKMVDHLTREIGNSSSEWSTNKEELE